MLHDSDQRAAAIRTSEPLLEKLERETVAAQSA
jgi:hypothetical protein